MFLFFPVYIWRNSDRRNYPIYLKFGAKIFMCFPKSTVRFLVYIVQAARVLGYTKVSQYIATYRGNFFKISFDMHIVHKI